MIQNIISNNKYNSINNISIEKESKNSINDKKEINTYENYHLEEGDYFPFIKLYKQKSLKYMHSFVNHYNFIIIIINDISVINSENFKIQNDLNYIILYSIGKPNEIVRNISYKNTFNNLFDIKYEKIKICLLNPNRKIYKIYDICEIIELNNINLNENLRSTANIPYLLIENVLSKELLNKILNYYKENEKNLILHNSNTKNRFHIYPDKQLEKEIDNKLSRSVFPEIKKIFYFDVNYRELYKICSYNSDSNGRFHPHRDTPEPYQQRRYAMSLFLNDDYEGGEFELLEYNLKIKPKKNTAIVFPGICSHMINSVLKGERKVIITFFCNEIEGKTKDNPQYKVKSDFFKENEIEYSNIYPI